MPERTCGQCGEWDGVIGQVKGVRWCNVLRGLPDDPQRITRYHDDPACENFWERKSDGE